MTGESAAAKREFELTSVRIQELRLSPVVGNFDAVHLREINRRIFQDMPRASSWVPAGQQSDTVAPGEYRPTVFKGDWVKNRKIEIRNSDSLVAYSAMGLSAKTKLDEVLATAKPARLAPLDTKTFAAEIAEIYKNLDYIHPFPDGNSRTLREFTRQLAEESGYKIDWERFNQTQEMRDMLCIARDKSVNEIALPNAKMEVTMRNILASMARYRADQALPELLQNSIRPLRAIAFENLKEQGALKAHPELKGVYAGLKNADAALKKNYPANPVLQEAAIQQLKTKIVQQLNTGALMETPARVRPAQQSSAPAERGKPPERDPQR